MKGIILDIEVLYFSTFRKPSSTSLILTYSIPPFTTIRGMIANALGLQRDDYSLQDKVNIGISVKEFGFKNTEMAKILKLKENKNHPIRNYPSSPMFREFVVNPKYKIYLGGDEDIIKNIYNALKFPERSLYLGQSDDLVDIGLSLPINISEIETNQINSIVDEIITPDSKIEKIPYKFHKDRENYSTEYKIISIPKYFPINIYKKKIVYKFLDKENVQLF
jgi:CRISPR-associated protein Cas5h